MIPLGLVIADFIKRIFLFLIGLYQKTASVRQPSCRFIPTCSSYTKEALEKHGLWKGSYLAIKRISKCHPLSDEHGYDPVP